MNRLYLGRFFLLATIILVPLALSKGGFWWAGLAVCSALALWGIGGKSSDKTHQ